MDGDAAVAESYFVACQYHDDEDGVVRLGLMGGRYLDVLERRDGRWGICHREVVSDWTRDRLDGEPWSRTTPELGGFAAPGRREADASADLFQHLLPS